MSIKIKKTVEKRKSVYFFLTASLLFLLALFLAPQLLPSRSHAESGVEPTTTISISPSTNIDLTVEPGAFSSGSQTINVSTNNYTGYTLTMTTNGDSTDLVSSSTAVTIPTITLESGIESITASDFTIASYGYSLNATDYKPAPSTDSEGVVLASIGENDPKANARILTFGAKTNTTTPAGAYERSFTISAIANAAGYMITYDANVDSEELPNISNMPSPNPQQGTISGMTIILSDMAPVRKNYIFLGWAETAEATTATIQPGDSFRIDPETANQKVFYAVWGMLPIQNWKGCSSLDANETVKLRDIRDNTIYTVAKLADNKCWMTQNMRLDFSNLVEDISAENTNNPTADFITTANTNPRPSSSTTEFDSSHYDVLKYSTSNFGGTDCPSGSCASYGVYYNWYTATAGNGTRGVTSGDTAGDLCPAGWFLPTGGGSDNANDFYVLNTAINNGSASDPTGLLASPANFVYSGYYNNSSADNRGSDGSYWSGTAGSSNNAYSLSFLSSNVYPGTSDSDKYYGRAVRCVTELPLTIQYNINGGNEGTMGTHDDVQRGDSITLYASNFSRSGYGFTGWNTKADGTGTQYGPMETIIVDNDFTILADSNRTVTLYATWVASSGDFQSLSCGSLASGAVTALTDTRDNQVYAVAKLADDNCWMIENLRLEATGSSDSSKAQGFDENFTGLATAETSDFSNSTTANSIYDTTIITDDNQGYRFPRYNNGNTASRGNSTTNQSTENIYSYGNYYTWAAAIASTGDITSSSTTDTSICPYGWHLPTGDVDGEFQALNATVNSSSTSVSTGLRAYPTNFVYSGHYNNSSADNRSSDGFYWSSAASDSNNAYALGFSGSTVYPGTNGNAKYSGQTIRCVSDRRHSLTIIADGKVTDLILKEGSTSGATITGTQSGNVFTFDNLAEGRSYYLYPTFATRYAFSSWTKTDSAEGSYLGSASTENTFYTIGKTDGALTLASEFTGIYMQDLTTSQCQSLASSNSITVYDKRDDKGYTVRYINGNCWMTQNLRFTGTSLNTETSDVTTNKTITWYSLTSSSGKATYTQASYLSTGSTKKGYWYNFAAATARTITGSSNSTESSQSICPKNWKIPSRSQFTGITSYSSAFSPVTGGNYSDGALDNSNEGYWWSSTANSDTGRYALSYISGSLASSNAGNRFNGLWIRCVARPRYDLTITVDDSVTDLYLREGSNSGTIVTGTKTDNTFIFTGLGKGKKYYLYPTFALGYEFDSWTKTDSAGSASINSTSTENTFYTIGSGNGALTLASRNSYMQNWTSCDSLAPNETITLVDSRDGTPYTVARLVDDVNNPTYSKCWMTENLRLDFSSSTLTSKTVAELEAATNSPASGFFTAAKGATASNSNFNISNYDVIKYSTTNIGDTTIDTAGHTYDEYGVYYNWYTATAGHGTRNGITSGDVTGDICPSGWHLPTGGTNADTDFKLLNAAINGNSTSDPSGLLASPANFLYSGHFYDSNASDRESFGGYWSSTAYYEDAHVLSFSSSDVGPGTGYYVKYGGQAVRCLADTPANNQSNSGQQNSPQNAESQNSQQNIEPTNDASSTPSASPMAMSTPVNNNRSINLDTQSTEEETTEPDDTKYKEETDSEAGNAVPLGVRKTAKDESNLFSSDVTTSDVAGIYGTVAIAGAATIAATGLFIVLAKKKEEDEDEGPEDQF